MNHSLANSAVKTAEILLNFYSWCLIASTHTAEDLYRFDHAASSKDEWYLHQLLTTANYPAGRTWKNWTEAWINFQIEHHFGPNLTLLQLERARMAIHEACRSHQLTYICESLPRRTLRMWAIITGKSSMKWQRAECSQLSMQTGASRTEGIIL